MQFSNKTVAKLLFISMYSSLAHSDELNLNLHQNVNSYSTEANQIGQDAQKLDPGKKPETTDLKIDHYVNLSAPDVSKYADDVNRLKSQAQSISEPDSLDERKTAQEGLKIQDNVASGHLPAGMHQDSIQTIINTTKKIRESSQVSEIGQEINKRREQIQYDDNVQFQAEEVGDGKQSAMRSQSNNIGKLFGNDGITAADWERKIDNNRNKELSSQTGLTIFASFSMPDYVLENLLLTAGEKNARVIFNGLKRGTTNIVETQAALRQYISKANLKNEPLITFDPESFTQYHIKQVPTMINRTETKFSQINGTFNIDYFMKLIKDNPDTDIFPSAGTTYPVEERNLIEELEDRSSKYDWEAAKKRALADTWKNQWMINLPPAVQHKIWYIDPTINVTQDVKDRQGRTLAFAGEKINPLTRFPQKITMIIFDPMKQRQSDWAVTQYKKVLGSGKVLPMFTQINSESGWSDLNSLRDRFDGKVFKINKEIIERFHIVATPVLISTEGNNFKVEQFSEGDLLVDGNNQKIIDIRGDDK